MYLLNRPLWNWHFYEDLIKRISCESSTVQRYKVAILLANRSSKKVIRISRQLTVLDDYLCGRMVVVWLSPPFVTFVSFIYKKKLESKKINKEITNRSD